MRYVPDTDTGTKIKILRVEFQEYSSRHHKRLRTIIQELYGWVSSVDLHQSSYRYDLALEGNRILSKSYR